MATITENKLGWNEGYHWKDQGDEWSARWGDTDFQWYGSLLPRIHQFLPSGTILEIAPGCGRWTQFLRHHCKKLILVDLSEKCIQACRQRFSSSAHLTYHVNDGKSLDMISDQSIDFVFSFDSLVHVEVDVVAAYLTQLARKLKPNGVGFIHHSNLGEFATYFSALGKLPHGRNLLNRLGLVERVEHWRALSMSAKTFEMCAEDAGLQCVAQEKVPWVDMKRPIDCLSTFTPKASTFARPNKVVWNKDFMNEAERIAQLYELYRMRPPVSSRRTTPEQRLRK